MLKTGAIPTVFGRPSDKRKISLLNLAAKRQEQPSKSARDLWYNTHINVKLYIHVAGEYGHSYKLLQQYLKDLNPV